MKALHMVAFTLVIVGALNWGWMALTHGNFVSMLVGSMPGAENLVYLLVGLSGLYLVFTHMKDCRICGKK